MADNGGGARHMRHTDDGGDDGRVARGKVGLHEDAREQEMHIAEFRA